MPMVQAWEKVNDPEYCGHLTMLEFRELLLRAGYSKKVAHRAALKRGYERLCTGAVM